ncbi:hypothetical protein L228DRAFT_237850 [Xylona heveae TC161]|uniref:Ribosomal RNA methyltransferase FtsJ domain-containing protein n=1 Tax=Xylona heveae (strain CBS 132557 / TC161) TaxID=1328760 RepID=A0A165HBT4_XYLHT|nr:hypothetical protein L228DRAFT_237850 [Xylona heveae TC161]KZF23269.1 hypothetical protein L228DRAFT_237850 [Xylona heveae TC161]
MGDSEAKRRPLKGPEDEVLAAYLSRHDAGFCKLAELREKGWNDPRVDDHYRMQQERADFADERRQKWFFTMMQELGAELHEATGAFTPISWSSGNQRVGGLFLRQENASVVKPSPIQDLQQNMASLSVLDTEQLKENEDLGRLKGSATAFRSAASNSSATQPNTQDLNNVSERNRMTSTTRNMSTLLNRDMQVLDLCMAPGGFAAAVLKQNPRAQVAGISLPLEDGGHKLRVLFGIRDSRVKVMFRDITMLTEEFGINGIPADHPDSDKFLNIRPYHGRTFDLVFCDGQVLRTHKRASYRESKEAIRLTCAQLILGLGRIKPGGNLVMLLHKVDDWNSAQILYTFSQFSRITLFKSSRKHKDRGAFYMIASNVQPGHPKAAAAVKEWQRVWRDATFGDKTTGLLADSSAEESAQTKPAFPLQREVTVHQLIEMFGETLIDHGRPIWKIQAKALANASFMRDATDGTRKGRPRESLIDQKCNEHEESSGKSTY